jgi:hypothetical protein
MQIITLTCPSCGTVVAGNVLETRREMKCEGLECQEVLRFSDLSETDREFMLSNRELYSMGD